MTPVDSPHRWLRLQDLLPLCAPPLCPYFPFVPCYRCRLEVSSVRFYMLLVVTVELALGLIPSQVYSAGR